MTEPRCQSSDFKYSAFLTGSGNFILDLSRRSEVSLRNSHFCHIPQETVMQVCAGPHSMSYCTLGFNFFLIKCNILKI